MAASCASWLLLWLMVLAVHARLQQLVVAVVVVVVVLHPSRLLLLLRRLQMPNKGCLLPCWQ